MISLRFSTSFAVGLFLSLQVIGQKQPSEKQINARENIKKLHDGFLLVRLQTRSKSLDMIRERGMEEKAAEIEADIKAKNEEIIQAFQDEYDFSPVYFFNSQDSKSFKEGRYDQMAIFNAEGKAVGLDLSKGNFLIAEFGNVQADTAKYDGDYVYVKGDSGVQQEKTYTSSPDLGFGALIIMSYEFIQLNDPFPSYVRTFDSIFFLKRKPSKVVKKMNAKLHTFY